jgi:hypothetical protein
MTIGLALVYDPRGHTFESWSALMVESYASQQLEINVPEEKWLDFASGLMAIDIFQNDAMPNPSLFKNWNDWAEEVVNVVNQPK